MMVCFVFLDVPIQLEGKPQRDDKDGQLEKVDLADNHLDVLDCNKESTRKTSRRKRLSDAESTNTVRYKQKLFARATQNEKIATNSETFTSQPMTNPTNTTIPEQHDIDSLLGGLQQVQKDIMRNELKAAKKCVIQVLFMCTVQKACY